MFSPALPFTRTISAAGGAGATAPQPSGLHRSDREIYSGSVEFGEDLMTIDIGRSDHRSEAASQIGTKFTWPTGK